MKKRLIVFLLIIACLFTVAACANNTQQPDTNNPELRIEQVYEIAKAAGYDGTLEELIEAFKGEKGADGTNGINGKDGIDGKDGKDGIDGATWYAGQDDPKETLGKSGDFYFDSQTAFVWNKTLEGWTKIAELKGGHGETGPQGLQGETGKSAYEIWLEAGYEGTEQDFLNWIKGTNEVYYVSFVVDGNIIDTVSVPAGGKVTKPNNPTKNGYVFDDWYLSETNFSPENKWSFIGYPITKNTTLYAQFKLPHVTFKLVTMDGVTGYEVTGLSNEGRKNNHIVIPSSYYDIPVISIGNRALYQSYNMLSVYIPDSIMYIGSEAFSRCRALFFVTIPGNVISIGNNAFSGSIFLSTVVLMNGVKTIGDYAFSGGEVELVSIVIPNSVTTIGTNIAYCETAFFEGSSEQWDRINNEGENHSLSSTPIFYSETEISDGKHWRYVDGVPTIWHTAEN